MEFSPTQDNETAGIVLLQNQDFQFRMEVVLEKGERNIQLIRREAGVDKQVAKKPINSSKLYLKVEANGQSYQFYFAEKALDWVALACDVDGTILSTDKAGGFVGAYIGMYCSANGEDSSNYADFDLFEYHGIS